MAYEPSNLTMHRGRRSVWDRQDSERSRARMLSAVGLLLIAAGTCLVGRAYKSELVSAVRCRVKPVLRKYRGVDEINNASEESFPASDPPAWTPTMGKPAGEEGP